jgi:hypothetical protein
LRRTAPSTPPNLLNPPLPRFANAVPRARARVLQRSYLPAPLHNYTALALEKLPARLCALPPQTVAALPNAFRDEVRAWGREVHDIPPASPAAHASNRQQTHNTTNAETPHPLPNQVCPIANLFKPALGGVAGASWAFLAAQISMGVNITEISNFPGDESVPASSNDAAPAAPLPPPRLEALADVRSVAPSGAADYGTRKASAAATVFNTDADAAAASSGAPSAAPDGTAPTTDQPPLPPNYSPSPDTPIEYVTHLSPAEQAKQAAMKRSLGWMLRACHVLYAPEIACNATIAGALSGANDFWLIYEAVQRLAAPADIDKQQTRIDERRFGSVAALAAALRRLPAPQRAALAAVTRGSVARLAPAIRAAPPVAAVAMYGPLRPWLCVITMEQLKTRIHQGLGESMQVVVNLVIQELLRLDEPAAVIAAVIGDSRAHAGLTAACEALKEAERAALNATAPARAAVGQASAAVGGAVGKVQAAVGRGSRAAVAVRDRAKGWVGLGGGGGNNGTGAAAGHKVDASALPAVEKLQPAESG